MIKILKKTQFTDTLPRIVANSIPSTPVIRFTQTKQTDSNKSRLDALLRVAEKIIDKHGIGHFKLELLIEPSGLSRRTIYGIFESKDSLLAMIAIRMLKKYLVIQTKAMKYQGYAREQFFAIHLGHLILAASYPNRYRCIYVCDIPMHKEKVSPHLASEFSTVLESIITGYEGIIQSAIERQEFILPEHLTPNSFARFLWDNHYGTMLMAISSNNNFIHYIEHHNKFQTMLFDALEWSPNSQSSDLQETTEKIINQCFAKDYFSAKAINPNFKLF